MIRDTNHKLVETLKEKINLAKGWISFEDFMQIALYEPGLGYYASNHVPVGKNGDFITAAETSNLYAKILSKFIAATLPENSGILELGAGTGKLIAGVLNNLNINVNAEILELSPGLIDLQKETLSINKCIDNCNWIDKLPSEFSGIIILNEVLDALSCKVVIKDKDRWLERGVTWHNNEFLWVNGPEVEDEIKKELTPYNDYSDGYTIELNYQAQALLNTLANMLSKGLILIIDYGFSEKELLHPQRLDGTLISHYQQRIETNVLLRPGLQDITSHLNFSKLSKLGTNAKLDLAGFTDQASFLIDLGIVNDLENNELDETARYKQSQELQTLLMPQEMGEVFKVMALSKNIELPIPGFTKDKSFVL